MRFNNQGNCGQVSETAKVVEFAALAAHAMDKE